MRNEKTSWPLIIGAVLILSSLCILATYQIRASVNAKESQAVVAKMDNILPERTPGVPGAYPDTHMPVLEIDGEDYIAVLDIPAFGVTLPVAGQWDRNEPSRFWGSAYDNTLIIGGPDYPRQFDFCDKIENGALVTVTDMTGAQFSYAVSRVDRAKRAETQWLISADHDLTLFCRDMYSAEYVAVRCIFSYK